MIQVAVQRGVVQPVIVHHDIDLGDVSDKVAVTGQNRALQHVPRADLLQAVALDTAVFAIMIPLT